MQTLAAAFGGLQRVLASSGVAFSLREYAAPDYAAAIDILGLPTDLVTAYSVNGPAANSSIPWIVEPMDVYSIDEFVAAQDGYRWTGPDRRRLPSWLDSWIVIASVSGDAYFLDICKDGYPVYFARHGAVGWESRRVAPTIEAFVRSVAAFESVLLGEFDQDVLGGEGFRADFMSRLSVKLAEELEFADLSNFVGTFN